MPLNFWRDTKSKQIIKFHWKRGFNGYTGVTGYADPQNDIVNNMDEFYLCYE